MINTKTFQDLFSDYPLYSQENSDDPLVIAKLFDAFGSATWYLTEYDPVDKIAFGLVVDLVPGIKEFGYISITEIESIYFSDNVPRIERDKHFKQTSLKSLKV